MRDYSTGLPLLELRHQRIDAGRYGSRYQDRPMWDGKPTMQRLLVWADEGLGDSVMMLRFLPEAKRRAPRMQVEVQHPVLRLCADYDAFAVFDREPQFDVQCSLMSLPLLFGIKPSTIPAAPYVKPSPQLVADWAKRTNGIRIGLCWRGNGKNNVRDGVRSIDEMSS